MIMELLMATAAEAANLLRVGRSGVCRLIPPSQLEFPIDQDRQLAGVRPPRSAMSQPRARRRRRLRRRPSGENPICPAHVRIVAERLEAYVEGYVIGQWRNPEAIKIAQSDDWPRAAWSIPLGSQVWAAG
jgi:hypothetical protein